MDRRETNGTAGGNQIAEKVCLFFLSVLILSVCLSLSIYLYVILLSPEFVELFRDG